MDARRIAELFESAIDIPLGERTAWLAIACGGDVELRAHVERLLRADERAAGFLEQPPELLADARDTFASDALPRFGPWQALRKIGTGGMGEVWLAERRDGEFEQRVAIKQLAWPTPGLLDRFRRERQILATLQHPSIARLIDGGVDARGAPFLAMEYVEGVPITAFADEHSLDVRAKLRLFSAVCGAVQYAHQNLVVHRDLKPSNIFVTSDGSPRLLDFGIAKALAPTGAPARTETAARLLTPDYAAPEQFTGGTITTAVDVYALGVVLHELLTGRRPARAAPLSDTPLAQIPDPTPPSVVMSDGTNRRDARIVRGDLDRIVLTALAADPQRRYPTVAALDADIHRFLEGRPIAAQRDAAWYRVCKFARRHRVAIAAAVFVFAVCIAATAISLNEAAAARAQAQRAAAVREFLSGVFGLVTPDANHGQPITAHQLLERGESELAGRSNSDAATRGDIAALLGKLYRDLSDNESAWRLLAPAVASVSDASVPTDVRARVLLAAAAAEAEDRNDFVNALAHARQASTLIEAAAPTDWESLGEASRIIALCLVRRGEDEAAASFLTARIADGRKHLDERSAALADEYVLLGTALSSLARFEPSQAAFDEGIGRMRVLFGDQSNRYATALNELAVMVYNEGDYARAETLDRTVFAIHLATLGPDHQNTLSSRHNLLGVLEKQGRYAELLPQRLDLLQRIQASPQSAPLSTANQFDAISNDYRELGRFAESETAARHALELVTQSQGARSARNVIPMRHVAMALAFQDRLSEAEKILRDALSITLEHGNDTTFQACGLRRDIGQILRREHRYAEAVTQLSSLTKDACLIGLSERDVWRPGALADLSLAQLDAGDAAAAYASATQSVLFGRKTLRDNYGLGVSLYAFGRAAMAVEHDEEAEPALREALSLRSRVYSATDPRLLEVQVALAGALRARHETDEARLLTAQIAPMLEASKSAYAAELREQLRTD